MLEKVGPNLSGSNAGVDTRVHARAHAHTHCKVHTALWPGLTNGSIATAHHCSLLQPDGVLLTWEGWIPGTPH